MADLSYNPSETVLSILQSALTPLSIDEICKRAYGRVDARLRNRVYVALHRLDEKGLIERFPMTFRLRVR